MRPKLTYRAEIDGLRTIAVLGVTIFHMQPSLLKGGFLGVDVFFVISGFLISSLLFDQFEGHRFSFFKFWKRRFKRLYPALLVLVCACILMGAFCLPNPERTDLPFQSLGALFSFSNILLWKTTGGYWSSASENISLLHTWSLSLEEQFYILYPISLFLAYTFKKKHIGKLIIAVFFMSIFLCVYFSGADKSLAFYFLPTRAWELMIGSGLAFYRESIVTPPKHVIRVLNVIAIGLIFGSYYIISNNEYFPGFLPIFPCLGTVLILWLGDQPSIIKKALCFKPVVYIGKISYSLYLWHWPIIVYAHYIHPSPHPLLIWSLIFATSVMSYHFIEQPLRISSKYPRSLLVGGICSVAACLLILVSLPEAPLLKKDLGNFNEPVSLSRGREYEATDFILADSPIISINEDSPVIAVIGDSHARVLCKPIDEFCQENGYRFVSLATSGIGITDSYLLEDKPYASAINTKRMEMLRRLKPDIILIAERWDKELVKGGSTTELQNELTLLAGMTDKLLVVGQVPLIKLPNAYESALRKYITALSISDHSIELTPALEVMEINEMVQEIVLKIDKQTVEFIDPADFLVDEDDRVRVFEKNIFLYSDDDHLNDQGSKILFQILLCDSLIKSIEQLTIK